ncbi:5-hydroxytryptamine receptor 1F-like [Anneissia japonica]|uniref:5-hydroxytryptamine receptor 1F-like n=1 Tax=Anneissia japonica TaxID=1529436 RepID=UPI001425965B|nr:5-hydroxytryptamine receptor 1F-like [Anneissia japonica]
MSYVSQHTMSNSTEDAEVAASYAYSVASVLTVLLFFGIIMNSLIIGCFIYNRKIRTSANVYFLSLACSDFMLSAVGLPLYVAFILFRFTWKISAVCYFLRATVTMSFQMSKVTVLIICYERYRGICDPLGSVVKNSRTRSRRIIVISWILTFAFVISSKTVETILSNKSEPCVLFDFNLAKSFFATLTYIILPTMFIVILYLRIYIIVRDRERNKSNLDARIIPKVVVTVEGESIWKRTLGYACHCCVRRNSNGDTPEAASGSAVLVHFSSLTDTQSTTDLCYGNMSYVHEDIKETTVTGQYIASIEHHIRPNFTDTFGKTKENTKSSNGVTKVSRILKKLIACYLIVLIPQTIVITVDSLCVHLKQECIPFEISFILKVMPMIICILNPLCYGLTNKDIKKTIKSVLGRKTTWK